MKAIKFSEDYFKLPVVWEGTQATLIAVYPCDVDEMKRTHPAFIKHDTQFKGGEYKLDFKYGLILVFIHINTGQVFTTIRRNYEQKYEYYSNSIGQSFVLKKVK